MYHTHVHRRCPRTLYKTETFGNSQNNLGPKCPNDTYHKLTTNGTFIKLFSTCYTCCHMATLQHYTFHRCIHANFAQFIHRHCVQSCFKKKTHKITKLMLINPLRVRSAIYETHDCVSDHITAQPSVCQIKKFSILLLWHIPER